MDYQVLAANLKRVRSSRQMSQDTLAEASGVSIPTIKNLERAKAHPRECTIQKIAEALGTDFDELLNPAGSLQCVRFRTYKKIPGRDQILAHAARWLQDYCMLEETLDEYRPYLLAYMPINRYGQTDPVTLAGDVRTKLNLDQDEPITDICSLMEHAGIKLMQYPYASEVFYSFSACPQDFGPAVIVNTWSRISVEKQIFSAVHEVGHLLMHSPGYESGQEQEEADEEHQADVFAQNFLMPQEGFIHAWSAASGLHILDRVMKIKRIFRVSYKVVLDRMVSLRLAGTGIWDEIDSLFAQRYGRQLSHKDVRFSEGAEPYGQLPFDFLEDRFSRLACKAVEKNLISPARGAEMLQIPEDEIPQRIMCS